MTWSDALTYTGWVVVSVILFVAAWYVGRISLPRAAILAFLGVALGATVAGFALDADAFVSNLAAETVGLAVSVVVAVIVAESLIERRRRDRWNRVARWLTIEIADRLWGMLLIQDDTVLPLDDAARLGEKGDLQLGLGFVAGRIRSNRDDWAASGRRSSGDRSFHRPAGHGEDTKRELLEFGSSRLLLGLVQQEIHLLRDTVTPRVLDLGTDERLVELLLKLENAERTWSYAALGVRGPEDDVFTPEQAWDHAARCYDAGRELATHLGR